MNTFLAQYSCDACAQVPHLKPLLTDNSGDFRCMKDLLNHCSCLVLVEFSGVKALID